MHCLRHLALLSVLVPFPSTSPYLLLLVAMVAYMAVRPCGYCLATLAVVFFSTSPSSPFLAALGPDPEPTLAPPNPDLHLSSPVPDRGAFYLNGGRIFDPVLEGYAAMQKVWVSEVAKERPATLPATLPAKPLPKWYHDLRLGGVGLVLDFGWRRTDEGLAWELAEQKYAAEVAQYRRAARAERQGEKKEPKEAKAKEVNAKVKSGSGSGSGSRWIRSPFVGAW